MKRFITVLSFIVLIPLGTNAQGNVREEYEKFRRQAITSYTSFREQCNKDYVIFLLQAWERFQAEAPVEKPIEKDLPPVILEKDRETIPVQDNELPIEEVIPIPEEETQPQPLEPVEPVRPVVQPVTPVPVIAEPRFEFTFFGTPLTVRTDETKRFTLKSTERNHVAKAWEVLSSKDYDSILADCLEIRSKYKLCDWAYLQMLDTFSTAFLSSPNEATLLTAYLFSQSGYKMRLGVAGEKLCLLYGTNYRIYGQPSYNIDGSFYYILNGHNKEISLANFSFPNEKSLSLAITEEPALSRDDSPIREFAAKKYNMAASCNVNKNLLAFYDSYPNSQLEDNPMSRWVVYANTPLDEVVKGQLYPALQEAISGKSAHEAADILLDFVQKAFEYEYDNNVWGEDRAFFTEETLYYPYCDCEDRAILYTRLVRDLLGLDAVLIYYPGHMATAVKFEEPCEGDYVRLNNERYLVCDPTYIGAPIGVTMPGMDNQAAKIILIR